VIEYSVNSPVLGRQLAEYLCEQGYEASSRATHLWAKYPSAADPTEERLVLGGVIAAWRREHPDARIAPADYEPPTDRSSRSV
jgi:hypothetical protein